MVKAFVLLKEAAKKRFLVFSPAPFFVIIVDDRKTNMENKISCKFVVYLGLQSESIKGVAFTF